jgi:hypothetical protein
VTRHSVGDWIARHPEVPLNVIDSLYNYAVDGRPTGGFLRAVLSNDLRDALGRGDPQNLRTLPAIIRLVYNELPSESHGDEDSIDAWVKRGGLGGRAEELEP